MQRLTRRFVLPFAILAAVILTYFGLSRRLTAQNPDYLTPQLRQQVNQLKRDAAAQPTNPQNVTDRGLILWQWINAYALTGGPVPVNATQDLRFIWILRDARDQNSPPSEPVNMRALVRNVDELIYEFRIKDDDPKAIPTVRASKAGPFPASSFQTFDQIVTIGDMPLSVDQTGHKVDQHPRRHQLAFRQPCGVAVMDHFVESCEGVAIRVAVIAALPVHQQRPAQPEVLTRSDVHGDIHRRGP